MTIIKENILAIQIAPILPTPKEKTSMDHLNSEKSTFMLRKNIENNNNFKFLPSTYCNPRIISAILHPVDIFIEIAWAKGPNHNKDTFFTPNTHQIDLLTLDTDVPYTGAASPLGRRRGPCIATKQRRLLSAAVHLASAAARTPNRGHPIRQSSAAAPHRR